MTERQVKLVQETWRDVAPIAHETAGVFYARLFAINPETGALFAAADMRSQRAKLMLTLDEIVGDLTNRDQLLTRLHDLGRRHVAYGVRAEHYDTVGEALLWTLEQVLGAAFTPEVRVAWIDAYGIISDTMQAA